MSVGVRVFGLGLRVRAGVMVRARECASVCSCIPYLSTWSVMRFSMQSGSVMPVSFASLVPLWRSTERRTSPSMNLYGQR